MSEPRCTCTDDESSDGSASYEDDPYCAIHGVAAECRRRLADSERVRRQLAEALRDNVPHIARGCRSSLSHNPAPYENAINAALAAADALDGEAAAE